jgi:Ca2+-binding EF-hand superfamily protein
MDTNSIGKVGYTTFLDIYSSTDLINEPSREDLKAAFRVFDK